MKDRAHQLVGLAAAVALVALCVIFHHRLKADLWPPDRSLVGPNLVAAAVQGLIVLVVLSVLYPPFRRAVHRFTDRKLVHLHDAVDSLHARHDEQAKSLAELHAKLDAPPAKVVPIRRKPPKPKA